MNMKRFYDTLRKVGLGDDEAWADVIEKEGDVDRAIDNALQEVCLDLAKGSLEIRTSSKKRYEIFATL